MGMSNDDAIKWLENLKQDIGQLRHEDLWHYEQALDEIMELLEEQEAVEPKTGYWIYKKYDDIFMCSSCEKYSIRNDYPYCHWCGARMKQEGR